MRVGLNLTSDLQGGGAHSALPSSWEGGSRLGWDTGEIHFLGAGPHWQGEVFHRRAEAKKGRRQWEEGPEGKSCRNGEQTVSRRRSHVVSDPPRVLVRLTRPFSHPRARPVFPTFDFCSVPIIAY